ncbi:MAG: hemerythrin domain-containing protein [Myxococcota bacterium]
MSDEQPGLRLRVAQESRRISSQHRQLDALHALVAEALEQVDAARAGQCFLRLKDALDAHMSLEDELYFPALHGLRPDLEGELTGLARDHQRFRAELETLTRHFDAGELGISQAGLDRFAGAFAAHELREESLVDPDRPHRMEDAKP